MLRDKPRRALKGWLLPGVLIGACTWLFGGMLPKILWMEELHGFNLATIGIIIATIWQYTGYTMALYLAGFNGISQDLVDAARLDGASEFAYYRHVAIPMLKPITISAVIILSHISLKMFDLIFAMTGPDNAETGHPALNMYLTTFRANDFARARPSPWCFSWWRPCSLSPIWSARTARNGGTRNGRSDKFALFPGDNLLLRACCCCWPCFF